MLKLYINRETSVIADSILTVIIQFFITRVVLVWNAGILSETVRVTCCNWASTSKEHQFDGTLIRTQNREEENCHCCCREWFVVGIINVTFLDWSQLRLLVSCLIKVLFKLNTPGVQIPSYLTLHFPGPLTIHVPSVKPIRWTSHRPTERILHTDLTPLGFS